MDNEKFGKFIQKLRKENNLTQKQLGEKLNITDKAISKWERGLSFPDISMLNSLADTFHISVTELLNCEIGTHEEIDVKKAVEEAIENITQSQEKKQKQLLKIKKIFSIISLIVFIGCLLTQIGYLFILKRHNYEYVIDSLFYIVNELILLSGAILSILVLKKNKIKNIVTYILFTILTIINLIFMFHNGFKNDCTLSFSNNFSNGLVLKQNKETGLATLYYSPRFFIFATPNEELPYIIEGEIKHQWLTNDICNLTYIDKDKTLRDYVVTYDSRDGVSSYYYITSSLPGTWQTTDFYEGPDKIYVDSKGITICEDEKSTLFEYDNCVQYGLTSLVLYNNDKPQYVIAFNEDCKIDDETKLIKNDGTISVCKVSMEKTVIKQFNCLTHKDDNNLKNYKLVNVSANDYIIQNGILYISYDGNTIMEVPGDFTNMENVYTDYNYQISSEKTVFFYNTNQKRYLVYSNTMLDNWHTVEIDNHTKIQNIHFINADVGFMLEIEDTAMGIAFGKISKTTDGGEHWTKISPGISQGGEETIFKTSSQIKFITEDIGFLTMPSTPDDYSELYVTKDSGASFSKLDLLDSDIYDYYNLPTVENGKLTLEISQGSDGDYNGNDSKYYISEDNGNTWNAVDQINN